MSRIALVTDSTAYLPVERIQEYDAHVLPLYINFDGETFRDGVDIDPNRFYERLKTAQQLPTTSQPPADRFGELYQRLSEKTDAIISIHISSQLSGTVNSAQMAREALVHGKTDPPEIYVIDSRATANGLALLVSAVARAIADGTPAAQIVQEIETLSSRLFTAFVVDTLEYLRKGGRIGGAAALVGSVLQVKPVLYLKEGRIDVLEKVRTARRAKQRLLDIVAERAGEQPIHACIVHAQAPLEAERIRQHLATQFECRDLFVVELSPVIAVHVGPGTVGVSFYAEDRSE
jgi:DegV family protein with EDD domain